MSEEEEMPCFPFHHLSILIHHELKFSPLFTTIKQTKISVIFLTLVGEQALGNHSIPLILKSLFFLWKGPEHLHNNEVENVLTLPLSVHIKCNFFIFSNRLDLPYNILVHWVTGKKTILKYSLYFTKLHNLFMMAQCVWDKSSAFFISSHSLWSSSRW